MRRLIATVLVFAGGFVIMVLEMVGARYLAKDFGTSFYVWTSQIGVILIALALGYYLGGSLADRYQNIGYLAALLLPAGGITFFIPQFGDPIINAIISRHPAEQEIPPLWQKLDPAIGSALVFLLPCLALASLSPWVIRLETQRLSHVGRSSGYVIGASTLGSIAGVFFSGYLLIDLFPLSTIFRWMGVVTVGLGVVCLACSNWFSRQSPADLSK